MFAEAAEERVCCRHGLLFWSILVFGAVAVILVAIDYWTHRSAEFWDEREL